jgi:hypothetical protein
MKLVLTSWWNPKLKPGVAVSYDGVDGVVIKCYNTERYLSIAYAITSKGVAIVKAPACDHEKMEIIGLNPYLNMIWEASKI